MDSTPAQAARMPRPHDVSLQQVMDGFDPERPFILMPFRSERLYLDVKNPKEWVAVAPTRAYRDLFLDPLRNPYNIPVLTYAKYVVDQGRVGMDAHRLLILGCTGLGSFNSKFARLVRNQKRGGVPTICVDSMPPAPSKMFPVLHNLGQSKRFFKNWYEYRDRFMETRTIRGREVATGLRPGAEIKLIEIFKQAADLRFAADPTLLETENDEEISF